MYTRFKSSISVLDPIFSLEVISCTKTSWVEEVILDLGRA